MKTLGSDKDHYEYLYPAFTSIVRNLKHFVKSNPRVLDALQNWSGFSKQEILNKLTYRTGNGPKIKIEDTGNTYGKYNNKDFPGILKIDKSTIWDLERSVVKHKKDAIAFLLSVTILHEFCHFGIAANGLKNTGRFKMEEEGRAFEYMAFDVIVSIDNAGRLYINFPIRY